MNSDFENFEQDLEDLEDDFLDFDDDSDLFDDESDDLEFEIKEIEFTEMNMRTAILSKNNLVALLCLKTANEGGAICRVDPRENAPAVQLYDDPEKARDWFSKSLSTSRKNGWTIVYDGLPLEG
ncbi:MAG: hypothetical protein KDB79_11970 [Acidobacteria bacterium]|nr:hypothetical protein [Acidobacteriota bacterium]